MKTFRYNVSSTGLRNSVPTGFLKGRLECVMSESSDPCGRNNASCEEGSDERVMTANVMTEVTQECTR